MASGKSSQRKKALAKVRKEKQRMRPKKRVLIERVYPSQLPDIPIPEVLLADIQAKRDLLVGDDLTRHVTMRYVKKHPEIVARLEEPQFIRSSEYEAMKKWVRQELRVLVGMFVLETNMEKLMDARTPVILESHRSTKERISHYPELYDALFGEKKPVHILDLCAGLNPCSYAYLGCTPKYTAVDVSPQLMDFVDAWFKRHAIIGEAYAADVTQMTPEQLAVGDTVLIFKGTDVLERVSYGYGEKLLSELFKTPGRRVIVSFATATIGGGREIAVKKRSWVERWADANGKNVRIHDTENERYYIIE